MLFESTPAEFRSAFDLAESVVRLRAATKRSAFASLGGEAAVGKVTEERVRLQRVIPMVRNSFQPIFVGRFERRGGHVVLAGTFTMAPLVKFVMTFWFAMLGGFAFAALLGAFHPQGPYALLFRLQPFLMICFGFGIVAAGKWFARNDAAWLSRVIDEALGEHRILAATSSADAPLTGPPLVLKVVAGFLALSGLLSVLLGIFGFFIPPGMWLITVPWWPWSEVIGLGSIVLSVGVWNRMLWAWWGGFLLLVVSLLGSGFALPGNIASVQTPALRITFGLFAAFVTVVWGRWWHAQRRHFK